MKKTTTITSKRQITIPAAVFRQAGLKNHDKLFVFIEGDRIILSPPQNQLNELAGSLKTPKKWHGKDLEQIIEESKQEYFKKK
jgi:AbrB family looped-hinge helix DNA binding protein